MIKLTPKSKISESPKQQGSNAKHTNDDRSVMRPEVVDAKVYKIKSAFVKNAVFVTLSYIREDNGLIRPIEIFINSKDLSKANDYVVLTRLISAIFRRSTDSLFILEELQGIYDPNGGIYKEGKYIISFYAEIGDVIERFFYDVGILDKPAEHAVQDSGQPVIKEADTLTKTVLAKDEGNAGNAQFKICPDCNNRTLKNENGCDSCMDCGYSKCDK
jgi:ribonucleoside-diphosphate reductase alpha chain